MPCIPVLRFSDLTADARPEAGEIKSGVLEIVSGSSLAARQKVFVRVYRTSSEHFAVLHPIKGLVTACRPVACLNLKSYNVDTVEDSNREFRVTPRSCEGVTLTFSVPGKLIETDSVDAWILALKDFEKLERKRTLSDCKKMILPVLIEEEE